MANQSDADVDVSGMPALDALDQPNGSNEHNQPNGSNEHNQPFNKRRKSDLNLQLDEKVPPVVIPEYKRSVAFTVHCNDGDLTITQTSALLIPLFAAQIERWHSNEFRLDHTVEEFRTVLREVIPDLRTFLMLDDKPDVKLHIQQLLGTAKKLREPNLLINAKHNIYVNDLEIKYGEHFDVEYFDAKEAKTTAQYNNVIDLLLNTANSTMLIGKYIKFTINIKIIVNDFTFEIKCEYSLQYVDNTCIQTCNLIKLTPNANDWYYIIKDKECENFRLTISPYDLPNYVFRHVNLCMFEIE